MVRGPTHTLHFRAHLLRPLPPPPLTHTHTHTTPHTTPSPHAGEPYEDFSVAGFTDEGEVLLNGEVVEKWEREEPDDPFFPPVVYDLMFVDQRAAQSARPVLAQTLVRPLGISLLAINTTYTAWNPAPQAAAAFLVKGLDECPMSRSCEDALSDPLRTAMRAASRAAHRGAGGRAAARRPAAAA